MTTSIHVNKHYQAPTFQGERATLLNEEKEVEAYVKQAALDMQSPQAKLGAYNRSSALHQYAVFQEGVNNSCAGTIEEIYDRIVRIKNKRRELDLEGVFSDAQIEEHQIRCYLAGAYGMGGLQTVEFDHEAAKQIPKTERDLLWGLLHHERLARIKSALIELEREILQGYSGGRAPTRKDEFAVQLEQMRRENPERQIQRHFIFNEVNEAAALANATYRKKPAVAEKIKSGRSPVPKALATKIRERTDGKYQELAYFFQGGHGMEQLSVDYAFDGNKAKKFKIFSQGGYIKGIDLSLSWLRQTTPYSDSHCHQKQKKELESIKGMKNAGGFFEALIEGEVAKKQLDRLCLSGNHFNIKEADALFQLIYETNVKHLDLGDTVFPKDSFSQLPEVIKSCTQLITVDFSNIQLSEELPSKCCASKSQFRYSLIKDEDTAQLLSALKPSKETMIEVWCQGPSPIHPAEPAALGNAARLSEPVILEVIGSFPKLVSYNFSYQKINPDTVSTAVKFLMSDEKMAWVALNGTKSEELIPVPRCCGCFGSKMELVCDEPSPSTITQISNITQKHRGGAVASRDILVVSEMYQKYARFLQGDRNRIQEEKRQAKQQLANATRHAEEAEHRRKLELAAAGASTTNIQQVATPAMGRGYGTGSSSSFQYGQQSLLGAPLQIQPPSNSEE